MDYNFALLIDSENASASSFKQVMQQINMMGNILVKRIYGDFTLQSASSWKTIINDFALSPIQQFSYIKGKNVTDSKMIIDAMDLLYGGHVNAFCIMSSDSDFTGIVKRLKEDGVFVVGAGKNTTPRSFVNSCDRFITLKDKENKMTSNDNQPVVSEEEIINTAKEVIRNSDEGEVLFSILMATIYRSFPSFDSKDYGYKKAIDFFKKRKEFKITKSLKGKTGTEKISLEE